MDRCISLPQKQSLSQVLCPEKLWSWMAKSFRGDEAIKIPHDNYGDWSLEEAIRVKNVKHVGVIWRLSDLQESCRATKGEALSTAVETFELANSL